MVACPLMVGAVTSCCGPPIVIAQRERPQILCCPPTAMCVSPLTLSASPNPAPPRSAITLNGQVGGAINGTGTTGATGTGTTGTTGVTLWQELPGATTFTEQARTTADAAGSFQFMFPAGTVTTNRNWYVTAGTERSLVIDELVQAQVTAEASNRGVLSGDVSPSHAGEHVLVERQDGSHWSVIARVRLNRKSQFVAPLTSANGAAIKVRVDLPADARNTESYSAPVTVVHAPR